MASLEAAVERARRVLGAAAAEVTAAEVRLTETWGAWPAESRQRLTQPKRKPTGGSGVTAAAFAKAYAAGETNQWVCMCCNKIGATMTDQLPTQHTTNKEDRVISGIEKGNHGKGEGGFRWQTCACTSRCECPSAAALSMVLPPPPPSDSVARRLPLAKRSQRDANVTPSSRGAKRPMAATPATPKDPKRKKPEPEPELTPGDAAPLLRDEDWAWARKPDAMVMYRANEGTVASYSADGMLDIQFTGRRVGDLVAYSVTNAHVSNPLAMAGRRRH